MREIVLGTAGHVDHGKTSLIRALTGIDTDRLKEEKRRGITIELGFAFLDLPCGHRLGIIDVPGHEKFVKNMVAGAAGIDLVAFVVAADEGIMPQTREHFEICSLLGVKRGLIVITKIDMVEADWLEMVQDEVRQFCVGSFLEEAPMLLVSSVSGQGIPAVKEELDRLIRSADFAEAFGPFRLPVDRIFSMKGFGAVVTGTSISGRIKVGDDVCLYPRLQPAKIRGIQVHGQDVLEVEAGHRTAINLQGLEKEFVARGDILASPHSLLPSYMLDAEFSYLSSNAKPLKNRTRVRVHLGTAEIMGRLVLLEQEEARPGERLNVQVLLEEAVGTWPGDHYVVRSYSPVQTIGGGVVLNNAPGRKRRRFKEINKEIFALYHAGAADALAVFHLDESGILGMTFNALEIRLGIFGKRLKKILERPISTSDILIIDSDRQWMVSAKTMTHLKEETLAILALSHQENPLKEGMVKEELRTRLAQGLEAKLFQLVINSLVKEAKVVQEGATVRLIGHQVALKEDEQSARRELAALLQNAALTPPTKKEIIVELSKYSKTLTLQILELMVRDQQVIKVSEDLYFDQQALSSLQDRLVALLTKEGEMDAQGFKTLTGVSRKYSIPLLEYFDKLKITIRVGDKRVLRGR
ncbi:MAG: selenocysteine-specific translation elongation factor [Desulfobulbaceae bacterium]|nr:selenocysteine-specific translation elongation factor [Desulfobulbaceae bacterium]